MDMFCAFSDFSQQYVLFGSLHISEQMLQSWLCVCHHINDIVYCCPCNCSNGIELLFKLFSKVTFA